MKILVLFVGAIIGAVAWQAYSNNRQAENRRRTEQAQKVAWNEFADAYKRYSKDYSGRLFEVLMLISDDERTNANGSVSDYRLGETTESAKAFHNEDTNRYWRAVSGALSYPQPLVRRKLAEHALESQSEMDAGLTILNLRLEVLSKDVDALFNKAGPLDEKTNALKVAEAARDSYQGLEQVADSFATEFDSIKIAMNRIKATGTFDPLRYSQIAALENQTDLSKPLAAHERAKDLFKFLESARLKPVP